MKRVQIYVDEKQLKELQQLKEKTGAPVSVIIRKYIEKGLKKDKNK